jgi:hypothetical protein
MARKINFNGGFASMGKGKPVCINFEGGFINAHKKCRKVKGNWVYSDTRDYRFDPSKYII